MTLSFWLKYALGPVRDGGGGSHDVIVNVASLVVVFGWICLVDSQNELSNILFGV